MIDGWGRATIVLLAGFLSLAAMACGDDDNGAPSPTPTATAATTTPTPLETPETTPTATALPGETPTAPDPGPCPVQAEICDAAIDIFQRVQAGEIDALMESAAPQPLECFGPGVDGFPHDDPLCGDAPAGTVMEGFALSHGGEGAYATADQFRDWLELTVAHAATAQPDDQDQYGFGDLRIAAIGCFSDGATPAGECGHEWIELVLTHISAMDPPSPLGGLPGRYVTCLELYWPESEKPGLSGGGCGVPPEAQLGAFDIGASTGDLDGRFRNYPWTPPADMLRTYPWSTRTGVAAVDAVLAAAESGETPPIQYTTIPCERATFEPESDCPDGTDRPVQAFLGTGCDGNWIRQEEHQPLGIDPNILRLHAIGHSRMTDRPIHEGGFPPSEYVIVTSWIGSTGEAFGSAWLVGRSGLVASAAGCLDPVPAFTDSWVDEHHPWLLPPR